MLESSICHLDKGSTNANRWVIDGQPPNETKPKQMTGEKMNLFAINALILIISSVSHQSYSSKIVMIMASVRIPRRSSSIRVINESWEKAGRPKHHFSSPRAELILDKNHPFSLPHSASWLDRDDKNMFKCNYHVCKSSHWSIKFNWVLPDIRKGHLNCFFFTFFQ